MASTTTLSAFLRAYVQVDGNFDALSILGLNYRKTPLDTDVTSAFRKLALILHPDKCSHPRQVELHTRLFRKVEQAKVQLLSTGVCQQRRVLCIKDDQEKALRRRVFDAREKLKAARVAALASRKQYEKYIPSAESVRQRSLDKFGYVNQGWCEEQRLRNLRYAAEAVYNEAGLKAHELRKAGKQREAHELLKEAKQEYWGRMSLGLGCVDHETDDICIAPDRWRKDLRSGRAGNLSLQEKEYREVYHQAARDYRAMYLDYNGTEGEYRVEARWLMEDGILLKAPETINVFIANDQGDVGIEQRVPIGRDANGELKLVTKEAYMKAYMEKEKRVERNNTDKPTYRHIKMARKEDLEDVQWREYRDSEDPCGRETAPSWNQKEKFSLSTNTSREQSDTHKPMSYASVLSRPADDRTQVDLKRPSRQYCMRRPRDPLSIPIANGRGAQRRIQRVMKREDELATYSGRLASVDV